YDFTGWYVDSITNSTRVTQIPPGNTVDTTLWARWDTVKYPIVYKNVEGATHSNPPEYTIESNFALIDAVKPDYKFTGWYSDSINGVPVATISPGNTGADTLWAQWKASHTVRFSSDGNEIVSLEAQVAHGETIDKPNSAELTKPGYKLIYWYADTLNSHVAWRFDKDTITQDTMLYAVWDTITYSISYKNLYNATHSNPPEYTVEDDTITLTPPTSRDGYDFIGWYADSISSPDTVTEIPKGSTDNKELWARWELVEYPIIYKNVEGVTNLDELDTLYTVESNFDLTAAAKLGYNFAGWYSDSIGSDRVTHISPGNTGDTTLWAQWIKLHTVRFSSDGNEIAEFRTQVPHGETVNEPDSTLTKPGHKFAYWYDVAGPDVAWNFSRNKITQDVTLYAKWAEKQDSVVINGVAQKLDNAIFYPMPCNNDEVLVYVPGGPDTLRISAADFVRDTVIPLNQLSGLEETSSELRLEKLLEFDRIVHVQLGGKLLMSIKNPRNNGNIEFQAVMWQRKVGEAWERVGSQFYYILPSGEPIVDTMRISLQTSDGVWHESCPYEPAANSIAPDGSEAAIYPNPASSRGKVYLKEHALASTALEERYETLFLFDTQGVLRYTGKASDLQHGLTLPDVTPGVYYLVLEGKNGKRRFKIVVGE
ncbi:MAG: InlB B-repeat-containing protein, partial [Prevotellaceae bacterium]|nr:InlB B-repeat-containing protein [Prevotellaceae bacterium]